MAREGAYRFAVPEDWQPGWSVSSILVLIISVITSPGSREVGGMGHILKKKTTCTKFDRCVGIWQYPAPYVLGPEFSSHHDTQASVTRRLSVGYCWHPGVAFPRVIRSSRVYRYYQNISAISNLPCGGTGNPSACTIMCRTLCLTFHTLLLALPGYLLQDPLDVELDQCVRSRQI